MKKLLSIVLLVLPLLFFTYGCDKSEAIVTPSVSDNSKTEITSVIETEKTTEEAQEATEKKIETAVKEVTEVAMSPEHNGAEIFKANCAACHAGGVNRIMANKSLMKDDLVKYDMYSQEAIIYQVTNGKNAMPPFKGRLSPEEIQTVADYVLQQADNGWS